MLSLVVVCLELRPYLMIYCVLLTWCFQLLILARLPGTFATRGYAFLNVLLFLTLT